MPIPLGKEEAWEDESEEDAERDGLREGGKPFISLSPEDPISE
jgi:hypothetical protein